MDPLRPPTPYLRLGPDDIRDLPREALPGLLAEAQTITAAILARLMAPPTTTTPAPAEAPDRLLDADEVAALLHKSRASVYALARRPDWKPFSHRINARTLRFSERGLRKWLARQVG